MGCSGEESVSTISLNSISPDLITYPKKEFIEDFICCICFNIPLAPKRCDKCLHIFCETCIKASSKCPYRCQNFNIINIDRIGGGVKVRVIIEIMIFIKKDI